MQSKTVAVDKYATVRAGSRHALGGTAKHAVIVLYIAFTLAPFVWALITSLKTTSEIRSFPPTLYPHDPTLGNYFTALFEKRYILYTGNSLLIGTASVILSVTAALFAGYVSARYKFFGKEAIMFLLLSGMAIGRFANVIPLYFFSVKLNLIDTYVVLVLSSSAFIVPLLTWLMRSYFNSIPISLDEAGRLDGCSAWSIFWKILVPNMKPAIIAAAIIAMVNSWNEYILAATLTSSSEKRVLAVAMSFFVTDTGVEWGPLTAAAVIATVPIVIMVVALQKYFIRGLTAGAISAS